MNEKNIVLKQYLYNSAVAHFRHERELCEDGDIDSNFGFFCGLCFAIAALELTEEYPNATVDDITEFMEVEASKRGKEITQDIIDKEDKA